MNFNNDDFEKKPTASLKDKKGTVSLWKSTKFNNEIGGQLKITIEKDDNVLELFILETEIRSNEIISKVIRECVIISEMKFIPTIGGTFENLNSGSDVIIHSNWDDFVDCVENGGPGNELANALAVVLLGWMEAVVIPCFHRAYLR